MVAYLAVRTGPEQGRQYQLDRSRPIHVGRGTSCEIVLTDPISSRFHAVIFFEDGNWHLRDTNSRNGTLVNGQKTDSARLLDQTVVTIGGTDMQLVEPDMESHDDSLHTISIPKDQLGPRDWQASVEDPITVLAETRHLIDLYQLSLQLLMGQHAEDVIDTALELLLDRTGSDVVGVTFDSGDGKQRPLGCVPDGLPSEAWLSKSLVRQVIHDDVGIWTGDPDNEPKNAKIDAQWSDAVCVPVRGEDSKGTLCLYQRESNFDKSDFEFSAAAGRLLAIGLSRMAKHDQAKADAQRIANRNADADELIGESPIMQKLKTRIERVGQSMGPC